MKRIYLHIGLPKTGTSSIQDFLVKSDNFLKSNGYFFPKTPYLPNHQYLACFAEDEYKIDDLRKDFGLLTPNKVNLFRSIFKDKLYKEVSKSDCDFVILSCENCGVRLNTEEELERLKELLEGISKDIKIIVYLRRQDENFLSILSQSIKAGETEYKVFPKSEDELFRYDYWKLLSLWSKVFSKDNLTVRVFEKRCFVDNNLLKDFLSCINLNITNEYIPQVIKNKSLDTYTIEYLRLMNKHIPRYVNNRPNQERANLGLAMELISGQKKPIHLAGELESFYKRFTESNRKVAKHFLGNADGELFRENKRKHDRQSIDELTISMAIEISAKLWKLQQNEYNKTYQQVIKMQEIIQNERSKVEFYEQLFIKASEIDPLSVGVNYQKSEINRMTNNIDEAIEAATIAASQLPCDTQLLFNLAKLYLISDRAIDAKKTILKAINIRNDVPDYYHILYLTHEKLGNVSEANQAMKTENLLNIKNLLTKNCDKDAFNIYKEHFATDRISECWIEDMANISLINNQYDLCVSLMIEAVRRDSTNAKLRNAFGLLLLKYGWYQEAKTEFNAALKMEPNNKEYQDNFFKVEAIKNNYKTPFYNNTTGNTDIGQPELSIRFFD